MLQHIRALRHTEIDYITGFLSAAPAPTGSPYRKTPACLNWYKRKESEYERIGTGFASPVSEETEAVTTIDLLVRGGIKVTTASVASDGSLTIICSRGVKLLADAPLVEVADGDFDIIVLPGGIKGAECFRDSTLLVETVKQFDCSGRIVAAICAAPATVLVPVIMFPIGNMTGFPALKEHIPAEQWQDQTHRLGCTGRIADQPGAGYSYRLWSENYRPAGWARESP